MIELLLDRTRQVFCARDGNEMFKMTGFRWFAASVVAVLAAFAWNVQSQIKSGAPQFLASDRCAACHNKLTTGSGEDFSHVPVWRPTMMANAARDPYWHASVRREILEHPESQAAIEAECSICHMPMMHFESRQAGRSGTVFSHLGFAADNREDALAADGVSCLLCHQIDKDKLGAPESRSWWLPPVASVPQSPRISVKVKPAPVAIR
jgi:hypothetical protein